MMNPGRMPQQSDARRYQTAKIRYAVVGFILDVFLLALMFLSGLSSFLKRVALSVGSHDLAVSTIFLLLLGGCLTLMQFPFRMAAGYVLEKRFGLSNQSWQGWCADYLKGTAIGFVVLWFFVQGLYAAMTVFPDMWWIGAGATWLLISFVLAKITPNLLIPVFFRYLPIRDSDLKSRIHRLFEKCQVSISDIQAINLSSKTKKANAFLCGIGRGRRVVLTDTLLDRFSPEEIEVVVAHELGHYKHRDTLKLFLVNGAVIFAALSLLDILMREAMRVFEITQMTDLAFLPMLTAGMMLIMAPVAPLLNGFSRVVERRADLFSLKMTERKEEFVSLMEKLGSMNLAVFDPPEWIEWLFYDHPSIGKRIAFARGWNSKL